MLDLFLFLFFVCEYFHDVSVRAYCSIHIAGSSMVFMIL